jgi:hypothetical protein
VKNALYFFLWLFPPKELVMQQQEKVAKGRENSSLFPCWFVFIVRQTFHVLLL